MTIINLFAQLIHVQRPQENTTFRVFTKQTLHEITSSFASSSTSSLNCSIILSSFNDSCR